MTNTIACPYTECEKRISYQRPEPPRFSRRPVGVSQATRARLGMCE